MRISASPRAPSGAGRRRPAGGTRSPIRRRRAVGRRAAIGPGGCAGAEAWCGRQRRGSSARAPSAGQATLEIFDGSARRPQWWPGHHLEVGRLSRDRELVRVFDCAGAGPPMPAFIKTAETLRRAVSGRTLCRFPQAPLIDPAPLEDPVVAAFFFRIEPCTDGRRRGSRRRRGPMPSRRRIRWPADGAGRRSRCMLGWSRRRGFERAHDRPMSR